MAVSYREPGATGIQPYYPLPGSGMEDWSPQDLARLRRFVARGDTSDQIVERLQRPKDDVWVKVRELGLEWRLADVERRKAGQVQFIAEYDDGSQDYFTIDCWTLQRGDDLAAHVAHERQEDGSLMPGKIVRVYRDRKIV